MELKVWVDGVLRVVCGLTLSTSCRDVVIALAQSLGQTGRYLLVMKVHESEQQLEADHCPLQHLAQLGRLSAEVQFSLRRTGPSLDEGPNTHARERQRPRSRPSEPQSLRLRAPPKASGSSSHPWRNNSNRSWSPSPRASPEPRASPLFFLNPTSPKEEVFRHILQQQQRLQDLQVLLQGLERETALCEAESASGPSPTQVEQLEEQLRQNQAELLLAQQWEEELQAEAGREREMHRRLQQLHASLDAPARHMQQLHRQAEQLRQDLTQPAPPHPPLNQEELLKPLQLELQHRLQQTQELDARMSQTQEELETAKQRLQDRRRTVEELSKELRQWKLQQFIQQSGAPQPEQMIPQQTTNVYLINAGILEQQGPGRCTPTF